MVNVPALAGPQLAPCALSGRAWRLWAAQYSQSEAQPRGTRPQPRGLTRAASKVADSAAFDRQARTVVPEDLEEQLSIWAAKVDLAPWRCPVHARRACLHACTGPA